MKRSYLASALCLSDFGCRKIRSLGGCGFLLIGLFYFCGREFFGEIFSQFLPFWKRALKCSAKTIFLSCDILPYKITFLTLVRDDLNGHFLRVFLLVRYRCGSGTVCVTKYGHWVVCEAEKPYNDISQRFRNFCLCRYKRFWQLCEVPTASHSSNADETIDYKVWHK